MKKFLLVASLISLLSDAPGANSAELSPDAAWARVRAGKSELLRGTTFAAAPKLVYTSQYAGQSLWYSFELQNGGWMIVSADDVAVPVLGYVAEGSFDYDALPPSLKWWLGQYEYEIREASASGADIRSAAAEDDSDFAPIAPLMDTRWDQGNPYNILCPDVEGKPTYTGCVATAMAQVMKYFNYPAAGTGSVSYSWNSEVLSLDLSAKPFAWDDMLPTYTDAATEAQKDAVAWLMQCCGYSVEMTYGTSESAANIYYWAPSLMRYFGYAPTSRPIVRRYFTNSAWEKEIYSSLENGSPVLYGGQGSAGGHAFVCDGYQGDGMYHFNWGWSGKSDGYYRLTALDPPALGTGGGAGGFNRAHMAVVNIRPAFEGAESVPCLAVNDEVKLSYSKASKNISFTGTIFNYTNSALSFKPGYEVTDSEGNVQYIGGANGWSSLEMLAGMTTYARKASTPLADGTYVVRPFFAVEGDGPDGLEWYPISIPVGQPQSFRLDIVNGAGTFTDIGEYARVEASDLRMLNEAHVLFPLNIQAVVKNVSSVEANVEVRALVLSEDGLNKGVSEPCPVFLSSGDSCDVELSVTINANPGTFKLLLVTDYVANPLTYTQIIEPVDIELLKAASEITLEPTYMDIECTAADAGVNVNVALGVKCTAGYYGYPIYLWVGHRSESKWLTRFNTKVAYLSEGQTADLNGTYFLENASDGEEWDVIANYIGADGNYVWLDSKPFTIDLAAIDGIGRDEMAYAIYPAGASFRISAPASITAVEVFNVQGRKVAADVVADGATAIVTPAAPAGGIYLFRVYTASGMTTLKGVKR